MSKKFPSGEMLATLALTTASSIYVIGWGSSITSITDIMKYQNFQYTTRISIGNFNSLLANTILLSSIVFQVEEGDSSGPSIICERSLCNSCKLLGIISGSEILILDPFKPKLHISPFYSPEILSMLTENHI